MTRGVDSTLAALADPTRRQVIDLLVGGPRRAGELARAAAASPAAMSRHLRVLRRSGLIEDVGLESDARVRLYRLRRERLEELRDWVAGLEGFWREELDAFKRHVERRSRVRRR